MNERDFKNMVLFIGTMRARQIISEVEDTINPRAVVTPQLKNLIEGIKGAEKESNVINAAFGVSGKRGKKAAVGGCTYVAKAFHAENPTGSAQELRDFMTKHNYWGSASFPSVYSTLHKLRSKAA